MIWTIIIPQPRTLIINAGNDKTTNGMSSDALSLSLMKQNLNHTTGLLFLIHNQIPLTVTLST